MGIVMAAALAGASILGGCAARQARPEDSDARATMTGGGKVKTIYVAGGCFWGVEKYMGLIEGVVSTEVGYANGSSSSATYRDGSGYTEAVKVEYDPDVAPLPFLLDLFYDVIDPTSLNRQGNDVGTDYRTGIYYVDPEDAAAVDASLAKLQKSYDAPVVVESGPLINYTPAEEYHQDYLERNPGGYCHIPRKLFDAAASAKAE